MATAAFWSVPVRVLVTGALVGTVVALPAAAQATTRPDLTVSALTLSSRDVVRGATVRVADTTRDARATAAATRTGYWLSRDRTHSASDRLLGTRAVPKLAPAKTSPYSKSWTIPAPTGTGTWYVVACADTTHKVRESAEGNNCRASASLTVRTPAPPAAVDTTFPITANPATVTPTFGTGTVTTGFANAFADEASSFTVTGPDGTTYTLDIPAQAVNRGVALKVTPLTGVAGAPLSSLVAGVRIEPTGLRLLRNATLTITPHAAFSPGGLTGLRFFDGGADVGMFPLDLAHSPAGSVQLNVNELASYVIGTATAANRTTALAHPPVRTDGQYYNVVASLASPSAAAAAAPAALATRGLTAPTLTASPEAALDAAPTAQSVADDYYDHVLKPALEVAKTDDSKARQAVGDALAWAHDQSVLGNPDSDRVIDAIVEMLAVLHNAVTQEYTRCTANHSLPDLGLLLGNARTFYVLGATADGDTAFDNARSCGRFQVTFVDHLESHQQYPAGVTGDTGLKADEVWEVHTAAPILMTLDQTGVFSGTGTLDYSQLDYDVVQTLIAPSCTLTIETVGTGTHPGTTDGTKATLGIDLLTNPVAAGPGATPPQPADSSLLLNFGVFGAQPSEDYTQTDSGCSSSSSSTTDQKWALTSKHFKTNIPIPRANQSGATITTYHDSFDNGAAGDVHGAHQTEATTVVVTHVPQ